MLLSAAIVSTDVVSLADVVSDDSLLPPQEAIRRTGINGRINFIK